MAGVGLALECISCIDEVIRSSTPALLLPTVVVLVAVKLLHAGSGIESGVRINVREG